MTNSGSGGNLGREGTEQKISRQFNWGETPPSTAVIRIISVAMNCDPTAVDPLAETVDPDALDRLLRSMDDGTLTFTHLAFSILLHADGTVSVSPTES